MLRNVLGTAAVIMAVSLAPASVPMPAAAAGPDPLQGLAVHPEWGSITGQSGVLRHGCHTYSYSYSITPPEGIWVLEVYISGPGLKHLGGGAFIDGYDPTSGTGHYTLCKNTTRYGTFTIDAKLSTDNGSAETTDGRLPTGTYRLHRPRRHH